MKLRLATKVTVLIAGVLALAVASTVTAMLSSWRHERVITDVFAQNLASVRVAEELAIALLEQRGFVSAYILDNGKPSWLEELRRREPQFSQLLAEARHVAHTAEEREILEELAKVFQAYDERRDRAIWLYDNGQVEEAKRVLLYEVDAENKKAYALCNAFLAANDVYVDGETAKARKQSQQATVIVTVLVIVVSGLSGVLLWLFFGGVLIPLRKMVAEVRSFSEEEESSGPAQPADELSAVGSHLRTLMSDVADTRSTLEQSRRLLWQSEKLASVGKLAASVAHEIRNPLTAIKMWLFSIRKSLGTDSQVQQKLDLISEEMARLEGVVQNFLEFSRPPALNPQPLRVSELLDKVFELLAHRVQEYRITTIRDDPADLPLVTADCDQLKQVFINLLSNAVEAMNDGGRLRVSAAADRAASGEQMVVVRIKDFGCGMSEELQARIFEPFFTTKERGTGLGLCIAARIMARHGGRLVLESSDRRGSCFAVWIPVGFREEPGRCALEHSSLIRPAQVMP